jgi:2-methylcitrate dehydratase PrpD
MNRTRVISRRITRRDALQSGAALFASVVLPRRARAAGPISPMMTTLSNYMAAAGDRALPSDVLEKTKQAILDTLAAMVSGSQLPPGRFAIQFARGYGGEKIATVAGSNVLCGPIEAALANGLLAHSDETDDTHPLSQSHPGCATIPAALACGEKVGIDGARFTRAVALGYDIGTRFTATLGKLQYMDTTHRSTHGLAANFCGAAAAACALKLNAQQMRWTLSYAAQEASGIASWQRDTDHIEKAFDFAGMGARNGVTAALLVHAGGTGVDDVLTGADNFFDAFGPMNKTSMLVDKLGEVYEITRTNVKKWTVGSPIQAPLDALENLMKQNRFTADQVKQIVVRVADGEASIVDNREIPDICLQHMLAVMLVDGTATFRSAHDQPRMKDPAILAQRAKVQLVHDKELERLMPKRVAIVEVTLTDGKMFRERVEAVRGTIENPMTREEMIAKARDLMAPVLGAATTQKLIDKVFALESVKNILEFRPLLQKA